MFKVNDYSSPFDKEYCAKPEDCARPKVLFLGSGIGLSAAAYLSSIRPDLRSSIVVADVGGLDILTHVSNTDMPRFPLLREGAPHLGGKLSLWGSSCPRPPLEFLSRFPYLAEDLDRRFSEIEMELGVHDPIPYSGLELHSAVCDRLRNRFDEHCVRRAPLAIDRFGRHWSSVSLVPGLASDGIKLLAHFQCTHLEARGRTVAAVRGKWLVDGSEYVLQPQVLVLALGVEQTIPLVRQLCPSSLPIEAADHIRIDLHGSLPAGFFGDRPVSEMGVAVFLLVGSSDGVPYHHEIKVAPRALWRRFVPSGDNLRGRDAGDTIYGQIQVIAAMHDRLPGRDLLNIGPETTIPPVMSARDAAFHGELVASAAQVADSIGLTAPTFSFRPLLTNHHLYGAFRVGKAVSKDFLFDRTDNVYILPPTSYVDVDDDANPTLKSLVLAQYATESIAKRFETAPVLSDGR